jgi:hypothetical protein
MDLAHRVFRWSGCCILYSDMILDIAVEITTTAAWLSPRDDSQVEALLETLGPSLNVVAPCARSDTSN